MTTKEKKEYTILGVLVLATLLVIYFNFLKPKAVVPINIAAVPGGIPGAPVSAGAATSGLAVPGSGITTTGAFLPNGPTLDVKIFEDSRFKNLMSPSYPKVTPEEIGSNNPFGE